MWDKDLEFWNGDKGEILDYPETPSDDVDFDEVGEETAQEAVKTLYEDYYNPDENASEDYDESDEMEAAVRDAFLEEEKEEEKQTVRLKDIVLPDALQKRVWEQYVIAVIIALATAVLCVYEKQPACLIGFLVSGVVIYLGISTKLDFAEGKITEIAVMCASVNEISLKRNTRVVFTTTGDLPQYFEFIVPGKAKKQFIPNFTYVIYFNPNSPKQLIGYKQV